MQVNSVSFKGLWSQPKKIEKVGVYDCIDHDHIYRTEMVYHPFKDETNEQVQNAVREINNSFFEQKNLENSIHDNEYHFVEVSVGKRLNITADDYAELAKLTPKAFTSNNDVSYRRLSDNMAKNVMDDLNNPKCHQVGPYVGFEARGVAW